jgi:uncharacterized membrane protein
MIRLITKPIWMMTLSLWLYPLVITSILYDQGRDLTKGLKSFILPMAISLLIFSCAKFKTKLFRKEEDFPVISRALSLTLFLMYYIAGINIYLTISRHYTSSTFEKLYYGGIGLFFILLGNILPKIRRNSIVGIRFSWTMTNDEIWRKVHYYGGIYTVAAGFLMCLAIFFFPYGKIQLPMVEWGLIGTYIIATSMHSWVIAKRMEK